MSEAARHSPDEDRSGRTQRIQHRSFNELALTIPADLGYQGRLVPACDV